jgi:hypothetical protein
MKHKPRREIFECPHCGADVPINSKVCRECGSDADTGWQSSEEIDYQSLDLPDGYADSPSHPGGPLRSGLPLWIVLTAIAVALALLAMILSGRW